MFKFYIKKANINYIELINNKNNKKYLEFKS